jgi:predicted transglutaminase-like cysteine proteinase
MPGLRLFCLLLVLGCAPPANSAETEPLLFGSTARSAVESDSHYWHFLARWQRVLDAEKAAPSFSAQGEKLSPVDAPAWRNLVQYAKKNPELENLRMVNGYFNQWPPQSDDDAYQTQEHWATPAEFMRNRRGDCEDYAIAKYFALRFLGVPARNMRVVIVRRKNEKGAYMLQLHAVLAVLSSQNIWFILDNNSRPRDGITPHTQYQGRFMPLLSVNELGAWVYAPLPLEVKKKTHPVAGSSHWAESSRRTRAE